MPLRLTRSILFTLLGLLLATGAYAAQVNPPASGFSVTGFIQEATLANVGTAPVDPQLLGGTLSVNGIKMIVPNNTHRADAGRHHYLGRPV